jgi:hypothetical protein
MAARKERPRTERREAERETAKIVLAREKLALREPGGTPDNPIQVDSAAVTEPRAESLGCLSCSLSRDLVSMRIRSHEVLGHVRRVVVGCTLCGRARTAYFVLRARLAN